MLQFCTLGQQIHHCQILQFCTLGQQKSMRLLHNEDAIENANHVTHLKVTTETQFHVMLEIYTTVIVTFDSKGKRKIKKRIILITGTRKRSPCVCFSSVYVCACVVMGGRFFFSCIRKESLFADGT